MGKVRCASCKGRGTCWNCWDWPAGHENCPVCEGQQRCIECDGACELELASPAFGLSGGDDDIPF